MREVKSRTRLWQDWEATQAQLHSFSFQLGAPAAATHLFTCGMLRNERRGSEADVLQQSISSLPSPDERGKGLPEELQSRGLREQAGCGSLDIPLQPLQLWEPGVPLELQLVRLVGWEFSKLTPCYSGSFEASNYTGWNATSLLQMLCPCMVLQRLAEISMFSEHKGISVSAANFSDMQILPLILYGSSVS